VPVLGVDIGTQSLKAVILGDDLATLGTGGSAYRPSFPRPGWAEEDARLWLDALGPAIAAALLAARLKPSDIKAMAVCGQLDGCVATDRRGAALAPAVIWMDRRAAETASRLDPAVVRKRCGLVLDATHMGAKIAWMAANAPEARAVATWHQPVSFAVAALTGARVMSRSLASTTMLCELGAAGWSDELLALFAIGRDTLPAIADDCDMAGRLHAAGAALTGLPVGLPVAVGTGDDFANLIGGGVGRPGTVAVSLGTSEAVGALSAEAVIDPGMLVETHAFPGGGYQLGNPGWLSGGAVRWAAALIGAGSDEALSSLAEGAPPGCDGLVFLPALSGAMAPRWLPAARGSFIGLTPRHGRAHMARAVLEGTAFAMRDVIDRLDAVGVPTGRVRLMGGGARSAPWCRIRADLSGRPVEVLADADASATGAALIAAVTAGLIGDLAGASAALPLDVRMVAPDPARRGAYDDAYARYRRAFDALEGYWDS
jgi:xylulokinase